MSSNFRKLMGLCVLALLALPVAVQAKLLMRITISGPGLQGEVEVKDQETLYALFDLPTGTRLREAPSGLGKAFYTIHQEVGDGDQVFAVNVYNYHPDPQGGPGHLLFADVINGSASIEGDWFLVDERTNQALQAFLAAHLVAGPNNAPGPGAGWLVWAGMALLALLVGLVFARTRRIGESWLAAD